MTEETPIAEIVLTAIEQVLEKYPKKAVKADKFCIDYGVDYVDELSDASGMHLLEILDSRTYVEVFKERKRLQEEIYRVELREKISDWIEANPKTALLIEKTDDSFLILKKNKFVIKAVNNNNVFHEYTKETETELLVTYIVNAVEPSYTEYMQQLVDMGCKQVTLHNKFEVASALKELQ